MAQKSLVATEIRDGQRLINLLARQNFEITAAGWAKMSDDDYWYLYIASPEIDDKGRAFGFKSIQTILAQHREIDIDTSDINVIGSTEPFARGLMEVQDHHLGGSIKRCDGQPMAKTVIDQLVVYPRLPKAADLQGRPGMTPDEVTQRTKDLIRFKSWSESSTLFLHNGSKLDGRITGMTQDANAFKIELAIDANRNESIPVDEVLDIR